MRSGVPPARATSIDTIVNIADPSAISMIVRRPAALARSSRSTPMAAPSPAASSSRTSKSTGGMLVAENTRRDGFPGRRAHALDADRTAAHLVGARAGVQNCRGLHPYPAGNRADPVHRESGVRAAHVSLSPAGRQL